MRKLLLFFSLLTLFNFNGFAEKFVFNATDINNDSPVLPQGWITVDESGATGQKFVRPYVGSGTSKIEVLPLRDGTDKGLMFIGSSNSKKTFVQSTITFDKVEKIAIHGFASNLAANGQIASSYLQIQYSTDGNTWTTLDSSYPEEYVDGNVVYWFMKNNNKTPVKGAAYFMSWRQYKEQLTGVAPSGTDYEYVDARDVDLSTQTFVLPENLRDKNLYFRVGFARTSGFQGVGLNAVEIIKEGAAKPFAVPEINVAEGNSTFSITNPNEVGNIFYCIKAADADAATAEECITEYTDEVTIAGLALAAGEYKVYACVKPDAEDTANADSEVVNAHFIVTAAEQKEAGLVWNLNGEVVKEITLKYNDIKTYPILTFETDGEITYTSSDESIAKYAKGANDTEYKWTIGKVGEVEITAHSAQTVEYKEGNATIKIVIEKANKPLPELTWTQPENNDKGEFKNNEFVSQCGSILGTNSFYQHYPRLVFGSLDQSKLIAHLCDDKGNVIASGEVTPLSGTTSADKEGASVRADGLSAAIFKRQAIDAKEHAIVICPSDKYSHVLGTSVIKIEYLGDDEYVAGFFPECKYTVKFTPDVESQQIPAVIELNKNYKFQGCCIHPFARSNDYLYITDNKGQFMRIENVPEWVNHERQISDLLIHCYTEEVGIGTDKKTVEHHSFVFATNSDEYPTVTARYFEDFNSFDPAKHLHALVHLNNVHFNGTHISAAVSEEVANRPMRAAGDRLAISDVHGVAEGKAAGNYGTVVGYVENNDGNYVLVPTSIGEQATGIEDVEAEDNNVVVLGNSILAPEGAEVYSVNGARVATEGLAAGVYVVRLANGTAVKVLVK